MLLCFIMLMSKFIYYFAKIGTGKCYMKFPFGNIAVPVLSFLNGTRRVDSNFTYQPIANVDMDLIRRVNIH